MKKQFISLFMVAFMLVTSSVFAQRAQGEWSRQRNFDRQPNKVGLMEKGQVPMNFMSEEQKQELKALRLETAKKVKPLKNELRELEARQITLTTADKVDMKAINKNIDQMFALKNEMAKIMAAQHQSIRGMLDEEQLMKFDQMRQSPKGVNFKRAPNARNRKG